MAWRILYVEDEPNLLNSVTYILQRDGFLVEPVGSGEEALLAAEAAPPDLILLDVNLPGLDGFEVCRRLKRNPATARSYVMMFTSRGSEEDIVQALEGFADDYITKPFQPRILIARIHALMRRRSPLEGPSPGLLSLGDLVIDPVSHEVRVEGSLVALTRSEFDILELLARRPRQVYSRNQIIDAIRGDGYSVTERVVDFMISSLRKKLGSAAAHLETVRGVGYRFVP